MKPMKEEKIMTTKMMKTGISPEYVKNWDASKAIREIVQNYLDSRSEFECSGKIEWRDGRATVKDYGPGIAPRHLALGVSEKGDGAIGKYGEGLKLALLVMAREDRNIEVWARGQIIRPIIEHDDAFQTEVMSLEVSDMEPRHAATHTGTSIKFECSREELEAGKSHFMTFLRKDTRFNWIERGLVSEPGGLIFVNGAMVGTLKGLKYSYHLDERRTGNVGNRDREVIDANKVAGHIRRIVGETTSTAIIEGLLENLAASGEEKCREVELGINPYMMDGKDRRRWKRAFNKVIGKDVVLASNKGREFDREAEYKGYGVMHAGTDWSNTLSFIGVKTSDEAVRSGKSSAQEIKRSSLTNERLKNLQTAESMVTKHYHDTGTVKISERLQLMAGVSESSEDVRGLYSSETDTIWLNPQTLDSLTDAVHVLLHEAVHKHTGASDCTAYFEKKLTEIAVDMMMSAERGGAW